jgi:hypothetical protein
MHYRFLVTFNPAHAKNSTQAREYVFTTLHDEGFCAEGRFSSAFADWFVVGGRWSGELSRRSWARLIYEAMEDIEAQKGIQVWGAWYADKEQRACQEKLAAQFQEMWNTAAPRAFRGIPIERDTYKTDGYEDDAMLLTQELYNNVLHEFAGTNESEYHADLDGEDVSPAMVGRKWLVVVDYHN